MLQFKQYIMAAIFLFQSTMLFSQSLIPVEAETFEKGNYWVWEYKNYKGGHNSFERYEVAERSGTVVTILMQSKLKGELSFKTHHKIVADIEKCQRNYEDFSKLSKWKLEGFILIETEDGSEQVMEQMFRLSKKSLIATDLLMQMASSFIINSLMDF